MEGVPGVKEAHLGVPTDSRPRLMLIGGEWLPSTDGDVIAVENPAKKEVIGEVPRAQAVDVDHAVRAADRAFDSWRRVPPRKRGRILLDIAADIEQNVEPLARTIALETGNAIRTQARGDASVAADVLRYFASVASELKGETVPLNEGLLSYTLREPIGVVGAIIPWNAPAASAAFKIAMALCAGNTMVLKPSEYAPLAVLMLGEICQRHLPEGVLNVVTGLGSESGAALAAHPGVRKLTFTGSTEVGKQIMHAAADRIAPVSLELGGKSPTIVFPDADDERVAEGVILGMRFTRQGQSCTAGSRLFLHESIMDSFLVKLVKKLAALKVGDPLDESTDMGSLINGRQFDRVCSYIEDGLRQAESKLLIGGLPPKEGPLAQGYYVTPTVFGNVDNNWRIAREEIFGPVLCVIPWSDEAQVLSMANDTHYGLAAFVWSHDISKALRISHELEAGWVQVNQGGGQLAGQSYGGYKQSGIGREMSLEGMLESFTQRKSVTVNLGF